MRYVPRALESSLRQAARSFPSVVLTGPRRSGKTWLLRHLFPKAHYVLLEDPDAVARFRADPQGFLDAVSPPAIFDEVQNVPELFAYLRSRIDQQPRRTGRWFLTGSQDASLMRGVTESMAGRTAVLHLMPMSRREHRQVSLLRGGYPEVLARPSASSVWFSSYLQTYLERDVRAMTAVRDLAVYRRFLALLATRHGQVLNKSDVAAPLGISVPTIGHWLSVLETTRQILLVPPYFENLGKRLIKSPKVYLSDSGLACHLLGITSSRELERSPFLGPIVEGFVASEIVKAQVNRGGRAELYYFRDQQGLEVDFLVPGKDGAVHLLEVKASRTPVPDMARPLLQLGRAMQATGSPRRVTMTLLHRRSSSASPIATVAPGVRAKSLDEFVENL